MVMMRVGSVALALGSTIACADPAGAGEGTWGVVLENDSITPADREYTSGIKVFHVSAAGEGRAVGRALLRAGDGAGTRYGVALGQSLFTPATLSTPTPPPGERPYAGWLYASLSSYVRRPSGALDILTADIGVVGPAALGRQAQDTIHGVIGARRAAGWGSQLQNEPGLVVSFDRLWRARIGGPALALDVTPSAGVSVGNVLTEARAGLTLRVGGGLGDSFGPARIRPAVPSAGYVEGDGVSWSVYGGVIGRAVARNVFLDGSTFRDSLSVERRPLSGDGELGASLRLDRVEIAASYVWRAREYETQDRMHEFGALTLAARF